MENSSYYIIFEILKIKHELVESSTIEVGERFVGLYYPDIKEIHFTDDNGLQLIFFDPDTYNIIDRI